MSGLTTFYQTEVFDNTKFFKSIGLFTSRYYSERNYLVLYPNNIDIETNKIFANTVLAGLDAQVVTYTDHSVAFDLSNPRPRHVRQISIPGDRVRAAVQCLFEREEVGAAERAIMAEPFRELDRCLGFHPGLSLNITSAQKDIIEIFVEPYLQVLRDNMQPWQITESVITACTIVKGYEDPVKSFKTVMRTLSIIKPALKQEAISLPKLCQINLPTRSCLLVMILVVQNAIALILRRFASAFCHLFECRVNNREPFERTSETNPNVRIINQDWDMTKQEDVLDALFVIGRVLTGKANLEGALLQSGPTLPNLQVQEQVVMRLLKPIQQDLVEDVTE